MNKSLNNDVITCVQMIIIFKRTKANVHQSDKHSWQRTIQYFKIAIGKDLKYCQHKEAIV